MCVCVCVCDVVLFCCVLFYDLLNSQFNDFSIDTFLTMLYIVCFIVLLLQFKKKIFFLHIFSFSCFSFLFALKCTASVG